MPFCFFETSKLVSPQFLLLTLFCFREENGEKTLQLTSTNFVYMRLPDLRRIARIAMASCTRKAKFEAVQGHYIKVYQSKFLLCYIKVLWILKLTQSQVSIVGLKIVNSLNRINRCIKFRKRKRLLVTFVVFFTALWTF